MKIKKKFQGIIDQMGRILNTSSDSQVDTYSCDYINKHKEDYSTTEQRIGTWIDGKPLYRKVIELGSLPNTTSKTISPSLSNVTIRKISGIAINGNDMLPLPYLGQAVSSSASISIDYINSNIRLYAGADRSSFVGYAILEYTKTTD